MRYNNLLWGTLLIILGGLFLLYELDWLVGSVWGWFWAIFLIILGAWLMTSGLRKKAGIQRNFDEDSAFSIDLQGAAKAVLDLDYGAGRVDIGDGAPTGKFLLGLSGLGLEHSDRLIGDTLYVDFEAGPTIVPFLGPSDGSWAFKLTPDIPISIDIDSGASTLNLDLENLNIPFINLDTGASSTTIKLPKRGGTVVDIDAGAASVDIFVPAGVAAQIWHDGINVLEIDTSRFPKIRGGVYQSDDFEHAERRVTIKIDAGMGKIGIH